MPAHKRMGAKIAKIDARVPDAVQHERTKTACSESVTENALVVRR